MRRSALPRAALPVAVLTAACVPGCGALAGYRTPADVRRWQDTTPPSLSLAEKAARHQRRLEERFQTPEGIVAYRRASADPSGARAAGRPLLPDAAFHTGIYLASQALRYAVTREPAARDECLRALGGLRVLHEVTGKRGLLARDAAPAGSGRGIRSPALPGFELRADVSKDQYAGCLHGLGVALALVDDPEVRGQSAELASAIADHLIANHLTIVDLDGEPTTHGDMRARVLGVPIGVNALIALAAARIAAAATGEERHLEFWRRLVGEGYAEAAYWAHFDLFGLGSRINDHMGYLALYPLLLLGVEPEVLAELRASEERSWRHLAADRNAFFAFVHAVAVGRVAESADAVASGVEALHELPVEKVAWPVDLTRPGFAFPRACFDSRKGLPRTTRGVPLHLRPVSSSYWAADPFLLAGRLEARGDTEYAAADYLVAYWIGRYHGFLDPQD